MPFEGARESLTLHEGCEVYRPGFPYGRFRARVRPLLSVLAGALALAAGGILAEPGVVEEVVATAKTGSRIGRQGDSPSPLSNYDEETMRAAGLKDLRDLVGVLAINAGAENNSDNLTQNFTVGTANLNLRGLGVASTLVLLNGRRQVLSAVQTDDGSSFVDLAALVPMLAVERVEVLKDGAAAIYGSEAVAGVANFITRRGFEGVEVQAEYRSRVGDGSQDDLSLDAVVGGRLGDAGTYLFAASHLDRTSLVLTEVGWLRPSTQRFRQPGQLPCSVPRPHRGRSRVPALRGSAAGVDGRQHDLPLRLCPAGHRVTRRAPHASLRPTRLGLGRDVRGLGRTRLCTQRHQPRRVAELPGAQYASRAGRPPGEPFR